MPAHPASDRDYLLSVTDAVARILADIHPLPAHRIPLLDALGHVLANDVVAGFTIPPWANSAMDGYAVRAADLAALPVTLPVAEPVAAGRFPTRAIDPGEATRIMTGAPVPDGADTVVRVEDTDGGTTQVTIRDARDAGKNVRPRGEDIREGATALDAGTVLHAAHLGLLASLGVAEPSVVRAPRIAILASGDELADLSQADEARAGRKIISSNSYTLHALIREAGGIPLDLGIAADTPESLRTHLARANDCDLLITSAGVSVGAFDYVRDVLAESGAQMKFWRVRMRPGAPLGFGLFGPRAIPWIGLPGNPVSTMVTFELFVRPAIRKLRGYTRLFRRPVTVVLDEAVTIQAGLTHFLRVRLTRRDGGFSARLTGRQSSGMLTSMARADALLVVPGDRSRVEIGESLQALPLSSDGDIAAEYVTDYAR